MLIERDCKVRVNGVELSYDSFGHVGKDLVFLHSYSIPHKSPHLSYTHFQLNQEIDIRDVNVLAMYVAKTSHERS
jgi:hypothetical protein